MRYIVAGIRLGTTVGVGVVVASLIVGACKGFLTGIIKSAKEHNYEETDSDRDTSDDLK